jgi:putative nucleotidyltransferase with HDIG domain
MAGDRPADSDGEVLADMSRTTPISWPQGLYAYALAASAVAVLGAQRSVISWQGAAVAGGLFVVTLLSWRFSNLFTARVPVAIDDIPAAVGVLLLDPASALLLGICSGLVTPPRFGHWSRALNVGAAALPNVVGVAALAGLTAFLGIGGPADGAFAWFACGLVAVLVSFACHYAIISLWQYLVDRRRVADTLRSFIGPLAVADPALACVVVALVTVGLQLDGTARLLPVIIALGVGFGAWFFQRSAHKQVTSLEQRDHLFRAIFVALARLLEMRDEATAIHSARVAAYSRDIAREMGLNAEDQSRIHLAGLLHDVGKVGVPDEILLKPGRLTDEERSIMERHARLSAEALAGIPGFGDLTRMVYAHHERLDGSGYPEGAEGQAIPLGARILGVADTFEAITSDRPYREAQKATEALRILQVEDHLFDQTVVFALQTLIARHGPEYPHGEMAEFADEWREAGQRLVVSDDEPFDLPPEIDPLRTPHPMDGASEPIDTSTTTTLPT